MFLSPAKSGQLIWGVGSVGGGLGKIVHLGELTLNCQLGANWNVRTPTYGPDWQLRGQIQFMIPK